MRVVVVLMILATQSLTACTQAYVTRTGKARLEHGREGLAPIAAKAESWEERTAIVGISTLHDSSAERLTAHLQRRGSLLGCSAITEVTITSNTAQAQCLTGPKPQTAAVQVIGLAPSSDLLARVAKAGDQGSALYAILSSVAQRTGPEYIWALRWYLETYPQSPFVEDVRGLLVPLTGTSNPARVASLRP